MYKSKGRRELEEIVKNQFKYVIGSGSFSTVLRVSENKVARNSSSEFDTNECNVMRELIRLSNRMKRRRVVTRPEEGKLINIRHMELFAQTPEALSAKEEFTLEELFTPREMEKFGIETFHNVFIQVGSVEDGFEYHELVPDNYSDNVVKIYSSYQKYQLLEYIFCSLSAKNFTVDLTDFVENNNKAQRLQRVQTDNYFQQLYNGIEWLHENKIFHRDISTNNVVISGDLRKNTTLKIIDFNLSIVVPNWKEKLKFLNSGKFRHPGTVGTKEFKSLGVHNFKSYFDKVIDKEKYDEFLGYLSASDFWSATVLCYMLENGDSPWETSNKESVEAFIGENQNNKFAETFKDFSDDNYENLKQLSEEKVRSIFKRIFVLPEIS